MQHDFASVRTQPVFDQIDALPGPERRLAADNRNRQMSLSQGSTNVRRHVIDAFRAMFEQWIAIGHQTRKEPLQIAHNLRVSVLLNEKARGRVPEKYSQ